MPIGDNIWTIQYFVDEGLQSPESIPPIPAFFANPDTPAGKSLLEAVARMNWQNLLMRTKLARPKYKKYRANRRNYQEVPLLTQWNRWYSGVGKAGLSDVRITGQPSGHSISFVANYQSDKRFKQPDGQVYIPTYVVRAYFYRTFCRIITATSLFESGLLNKAARHLGYDEDKVVEKFLRLFYDTVESRLGYRADEIFIDGTSRRNDRLLIQIPSIYVNPMSCGCTCLDWRFMFSWPGVPKGVTLGGKAIPYIRKTPLPSTGGQGAPYGGGGDWKSPRPYKNPDQIEGICKHNYFLISKLVEEGFIGKYNAEQDLHRKIEIVFNEVLEEFIVKLSRSIAKKMGKVTASTKTKEKEAPEKTKDSGQPKFYGWGNTTEEEINEFKELRGQKIGDPNMPCVGVDIYNMVIRDRSMSNDLNSLLVRYKNHYSPGNLIQAAIVTRDKNFSSYATYQLGEKIRAKLGIK